MNTNVGAVKITVLTMTAALLTSTGAANANDAETCGAALVNQQWAKAVTACLAAAEDGNVTAQFNLGLMYSLGKGVAQDYARSAHWYAQAAKQGDSDSQNNLGLMYYLGQGVVQDYAQALRWYKLAAEQGNVLAQNNLGSMYGNGRGVTQDYVKAHMWYNLAAVSGNEDSVKGRDVAASKMTREQIAQAQKMARDCSSRKYRNC